MPPSPTSRLENWLDNFLSYQNLPQKKDFWLDTMRFLCARFGHPEKCAPCVHVAGSKGKGSVTEMVASIMDAYGYKCGLYQSPHISDFRERVKLAHGFFPDEIYKDAAEELIGGIEAIQVSDLPNGRPVTWFELVTLYAFLCFRAAKVGFAVYEVGLGGKLDATNVVTPELCLITQIELEHTEFLGGTIEKVAREKAGIIKPGVPVIIGMQANKSVYGVVGSAALSAGSQYERTDSLICEIKSEPCKTGDQAGNGTLYTKTDISSPLFARKISASLQLLGNVQAENAALAAAAAKKLIPQVSESVIEKGLSQAFLPGRFEIMPHLMLNAESEPKRGHICGKNYPVTLVLDGAHTFTSIKNTIRTLRDFFPNEKFHALFACAKDKDVSHIAKLFRDKFEHVTITKPGSSKACDTKAVCAAFKKENINFEFQDDTKAALEFALDCAMRKKAVLLSLGSFYLIAEIKVCLP